MASNYLITLDNDEMGEIKTNQMYFVNSPNHVKKYVQELSRSWPNSTICVYRLSEMQKISVPAQYAHYKVNDNGEVLPA